MKKRYTLDTGWQTFKTVTLHKSRYPLSYDDRLKVRLRLSTKQSLAIITSNVKDTAAGPDESYLNVCKYPWAPYFLIQNAIAEPTGEFVFTKDGCFPKFKFDLKKLEA